MTTSVPRCVLGIATANLSAWRDHASAAHEAQVLATHIPGCAACQQRLELIEASAPAMPRQHAPHLRARVWQGVQRRLMLAARFHLSRTVVVGGLSAALAVTLLFAALVFSRLHGGSPHSIAVVPTAGATATPVSHPTVAPTVLTPTQAWGDYAKTSLTRADIGGYAIQDIFPDGSAAVGERYDGSDITGASFSTIPIASSKHAHMVYTTPGAISLFARTDGRFIAWMSTLRESGGPDAGREFAGYLDLQTQRVTTLAGGAITNTFVIAEMAVDHGYLLWLPEQGDHPALVAINMLTGQSTTIAPNLSNATVPDIQFSYPYVFYTIDAAAHLYNLATGHDAVLSQVQPQASDVNVFALDGSSLFWAHGGDTSAAIEEIDHADQAGARIQRVIDYPIASIHAFPYELAANDRLIALGSAAGVFVWDRAQQRLIAVTAVDADPTLFVRGATFAFATSSGVNPTYTFIDTTKLPTKAPR